MENIDSSSDWGCPKLVHRGNVFPRKIKNEEQFSFINNENGRPPR